jgi:hypothetical protein
MTRNRIVGIAALLVLASTGQAQQVLHDHVRPEVTSGQAARVGSLPAGNG